MKILYGVQGTGNGHIARSRVMAQHFKDCCITVDFIFSGREQSEYFDMEIFGDCQYKSGLSFSTKNGKVSILSTLLNNRIFRFIRDIFALKVDGYDFVITDFEPVVAWAAKLLGVKTIGVGHQYAFGHNVPRTGDSMLTNWIMKNFAPVNLPIGLHWDSFDSTILPPIIETDLSIDQANKHESIVVYLPFENQNKVTQCLKQLIQYQFIQYSSELFDEKIANVHRKKSSHSEFHQDLCRCAGVICNAGFELNSECLHLGLPILTKPLHGQMEQLSNAKSLEILNLATTMHTLNTASIQNWLTQKQEQPAQNYPDVAKSIVEAIKNAKNIEDIDLDQLTISLWQ